MSRGLALTLVTAIATAVLGAFSLLIITLQSISRDVSAIQGAMPHLVQRMDRHAGRLDRLERGMHGSEQ